VGLQGSRVTGDLPERTLLPVPAGIRPARQRARDFHFAFGLRGTVNSAADGMQGIGLGPETRWRLSGRLSLFTGLLYENQRKNGFFSFAQREDANFSSSPITVVQDPSGDVVNAVSQDVDARSVESLTNSFGFLHIPAGVEFFPGRTVSFQAGARYSRVLGAWSKDKIAVVDDDQIQQGGLNQLSDVSRNALYQNDFVGKNDLSLLFGANVYLWRRLALSLEYNHGLFPVFQGGDNSVSDARNRMLSLGLRYHFSRV
jgi:hypothetical protein